nr:MAG TPA: hypothetical protein [Bacteriophage sp.]
MEFETVLVICVFVLWTMRAIQKATHNKALKAVMSLIALVAFCIISGFALLALPTTETVWAIMFGMWASNVIIQGGDDDE